MADKEHDVPVVTDKPRKRKSEGRQKERIKKQKLSAHTTGPDCMCPRLKCFQVVNEENRARLIAAFNALPTKDAQDSYLASLVTVTEIARHRPRLDEPKSNNSNSYHYTVFISSEVDKPDGFAYVCFKAFLSIFGIKKGRLETIKKSLACTGEPPIDKRGKHPNRPHKLSDLQQQQVEEHISSFHGRQSHYSREKTRKIYLPQELNISKMHELYSAKHQNPVSYESYRTIFNTRFNIGFGYPRTDTCSKCDELSIQIEALQKSDPESSALHALKVQRDVHQAKAGTFYQRKRDSKERARKNSHLESYAFDFQKNLNVPSKSTNDFYYHRKLTFHSFNIHQLASDEVFIYGYDETVAKKGSDEVASFLYHHFMNHVPADVTHLELFCDSCAGQNKNYTLIRLFDFLVHHEEKFESIKVTFPERGHSYMECDRDMGSVNTKASVNTPSDWLTQFREARKSPSPYNVIEVDQEIVKNFSEFLRPLYKKGCAMPTRPIREMVFKRGDRNVVCHRDSWNGVFLKTGISFPGRRGRPQLATTGPQRLYKKKITNIGSEV